MKKDGAFLAALLLMMAKLSYGVFDVYDLGHFDESYYRMAARDWFLRGVPFEADHGPLYSLWNLGWDLSVATPFAAHYGNSLALFFLVGLTTYFLARRLTTPGGALIAAAAISLLPLNLPAQPKVYLFSAWLVLSLCALAFGVRRRSVSLSLVMTGLVISVFVLPSNTVAVLAVVPLFAWALFREGKSKETKPAVLAYLAALPLAAGTALTAWLGNPLSGGNFLTLFSMRFVRWWAEKNQPDFNWGLNFATKWNELFPHATGVASAILEKPGLFARFFLSYLHGIPEGVSDALFLNPFLAAALAVSLVAQRKQIPAFLKRLKSQPTVAVTLLAVALPSFLTTDYTTFALVFWIFAGAWLAFVVPSPRFEPMPSLPALTAVVMLLLLTPFTRSPWDYSEPPDKPNLRMVKAINRVPFRDGEPLVIADDYRGIASYLDRRFVRLPHWKREAPFSEFIKRREVGLVITLPEQPFSPPQEFAAFEAAPEKFGFRKFPVHNHTAFYVRTDRLLPALNFTRRD